MTIQMDDAHAPEGKALHLDWVDYLAKANAPWHWFCTFTFKYDITALHAERLFKRWVARLCRSLNHNRKSSTQVRLSYALAIEYTTLNRVHMHAVIKTQCGSLAGSNMMRWENRWESISHGSGMAKIGKAGSAACKYVVKYTAKRGRLSMGGPFATWQRNPLVSRKVNQPTLSGDNVRGGHSSRLPGVAPTDQPERASHATGRSNAPERPDGSPG